MKRSPLVIRSVAVGAQNIRTWKPDDPGAVAMVVSLDIGPRQGRGEAADTFWIRVATPAGLALLEAHDGIVATRPLLVIERYNFDELMVWLENTVAECADVDWPTSRERLRRYFGWEYDNCSEK